MHMYEHVYVCLDMHMYAYVCISVHSIAHYLLHITHNLLPTTLPDLAVLASSPIIFSTMQLSSKILNKVKSNDHI